MISLTVNGRSLEVDVSGAARLLDVLRDEDLQRHALETGGYLIRELRRLAESHSIVGDVRGSGFFIAVDLVSDPDTRAPAKEAAARIVNSLRGRGVLTNTIGRHSNILKLRPPMCFGHDDADFFLDRLSAVLDAL